MTYSPRSRLYDGDGESSSFSPPQRLSSAANVRVARLPVPSAGPGRADAAQRLPGFSVSRGKYGGLPRAHFERPVEVDSFSMDGRRAFSHDRSMLRRFAGPEPGRTVHYELSAGFDTFIKRDWTVKDYLDNVLRCLTLSGRPLAARADFVCWRGLLTQTLCAPYESRDGWVVAACKLGSTIYMCEFDEPDDYPNAELMSYWGHKFEQYVTAKPGHRLPETSEPVNNHEGFYSVVAATLNRHKLLYGAEVDCCRGTSRDPLSTYVELKTNRSFDNATQERNFRKYKLVKWWAQSFLLGVPEVVCGFRDDAGIVSRVAHYRTDDMPGMVEGSGDDMWDPAVCLNFLDDFLNYVKSTVALPERIYVFERAPGRFVTATQVPLADESFNFLPTWYKDHCQKMTAEAR